MTAWWAPLGAGVRRLLGGGVSSAGTPASSTTPSGAPAAPERPPQAWPWQPPVQRVVDSGWVPALRPDDFAGGLASHQDPSLRRDLVHDVRPSAGGLVDGLADMVPGRPRTYAGSGDLPVRPVRHEPAPVQRSLAGFATDGWADAGVSGDAGVEPMAVGTGDSLATVELQPPWSVGVATPTTGEAPGAAPSAAASSPTGAPSTTFPVVARAAAGPAPARPSVPLGARDVSVQRSTEPAASAPAPEGTADDPAPAADPFGSLGVLPVVRSLPIAEAPPPRPGSAIDLPVAARALPVLQRRTVDPAPVVPGPASDAGPAAPQEAVLPGTPTEAAPLSSFADAIQRLSVDESGAGGAEDPRPEPGAPELVLPSRSVERLLAGPTAAVSAGPGMHVQRSGVEPVEPSSGLSGAVPVAGPDAPAAPTSTPVPLLGAGTVVARTTEPSPSAPAPPDDLGGLPVLPASRPVAGPAALDAVPRLEAVPSLPSASVPPVDPTTSSAGAAAAPVVARTLSDQHVDRSLMTPLVPAPSATRSPASVGPTAGVTATAPLTGDRAVRVQRVDTGLQTSAARTADPVVQPLRFGGPGAPAGREPGSTAAARPVAALSREASAPPSPGNVARSVQRATDVPAVAPGLVGPAPVLAEVGSGSWSSDAADVRATPVERSGTGTPAAEFEGGGGAVPGVRRAEGAALQRLPVTAPPVRPTPPAVASQADLPVPVRVLPFDAMFGPGADVSDHVRAGTDGAGEDGWTSVDLPVRDGPGVQRAVETDQVVTEPAAPTPPPEPPAPAPAAPAPAAPAAVAPAAGGAMPSGADLDEMARRLFDPLSARLRAELWLDRERSGLVVDARL